MLKNALDWASRNTPDPSPINNKPVAIMGAGGGMGTIRAQMHLRDILLHNDLKVLGRPSIMINRAWEQFDNRGRLKDETLHQRLGEMLVALREWTLQLQK